MYTHRIGYIVAVDQVPLSPAIAMFRRVNQANVELLDFYQLSDDRMGVQLECSTRYLDF